MKHGLTGDGIVLPTEDVEFLDIRISSLETEMKPTSTLARQLVGRVALMTIRLDRSAEHEAKAIGHRMRKARAEFDDARLAEMENLYSWIAAEPATNARRLRSSPEGLTRLLNVMTDLRADLAHPEGHRWDWQRCEQLHHILGLRPCDVPVSRARALNDAMEGNFRNLSQADGGDLALKDRQDWAKDALIGLIDVELAKLQVLYDRFDHEGLELDREEAAHRAMFDASPAAVLARKYEAATERGLYRALKEFREVQATMPQVVEEPVVANEPLDEMGSSFPEAPEETLAESDVDSVLVSEPGVALDEARADSPNPQDNRKPQKRKPPRGR